MTPREGAAQSNANDFAVRWINTLLAARIVSFAAFCLAFRGVQPACAQAGKIPLPPPQKAVDYSRPLREYDTVYVGGQTVCVERPLQTASPVIADQALARLRAKLGAAWKALPAVSCAALKKLPLFLMYGPNAKGGGRDNGLEYFQKNAPAHDKTLDARWSDCIVVYCADNYVHISELWALKALVHEFAHAYQLARWPEDQPDIYQAWANAKRRGLYHDVKDDQGKTITEAYALVNPLEYFAELSCMYFAGCNYQPFSRAELRVYDPVGCAMIEKMWQIRTGDAQEK